jgi:16S rRNA (guanine1516-N2)-methyltransferase
MNPPLIAVCATTDDLQPRAAELAGRLRLPLTAMDDAVSPLLLVVTPERLELRQTGPKAPGPVHADFVGGRTGHRRRFGGGKGQSIARAIGLKGGTIPSVLDATAGLGRDAFVLASLGCRVRLLERSAVIACLLEDGLRRAAGVAETAAIVANMELIHTDALPYLENLARISRHPSTAATDPSVVAGSGKSGPGDDARPDVVYLDPMYPHRSKSALVKKEMRIFRQLVGDDEDASRLLAAALDVARRRVVVKRPRLAPSLDGPEPNTRIVGKTTRYDVYVMAALGACPGKDSLDSRRHQ